MTGNKYIELDSSYRDRTLYPLSSQFVVPINQSTIKTKQSAVDPICDSAPIKVFSGSFNLANTNSHYIVGTIVMGDVGVTNYGIGNSSSQYDFIIRFVNNLGIGALQTPVQIEDYYVGAVISAGGLPTEHRRITKCKYLYADSSYHYVQFSIDFAFSSSISNTSQAYISNPSVTTTAVSFIFIPRGSSFNNFYNNYYIQNQTDNQTRKIIKYDGITRIAQVDIPFTNFDLSDTFAIRLSLPLQKDALSANGTTTTAVLAVATASLVDNFYKGDFIRFYSATSTLNDVRRIIKYEASSRRVTFSPEVSAATALGDLYEILPFTKDNAVAFNYTGNELGSQEMVCYDIMLINVIIPNKALSVAGSKRLPFYTHVYVEFTNETAPGSGQTGLIYSNNPNSNRMLFRATIDDIASPLNTAFLKCNGDNMVQTIKFKPNDNLRFSVRLHTGEYLQFEDSENFSPLAPNPDIQISAIFSINRVIDS